MSLCPGLNNSSRVCFNAPYLFLCLFLDMFLPRFEFVRLFGFVFLWVWVAIWKGFWVEVVPWEVVSLRLVLCQLIKGDLSWALIVWDGLLVTIDLCQILKGDFCWALNMLVGEGAGGGIGGGAGWKKDMVVCLGRGMICGVALNCDLFFACGCCEASSVGSSSFQCTVLFASFFCIFCGGGCCSWRFSLMLGLWRCCCVLAELIESSSSSVRSTKICFSWLVMLLLFWLGSECNALENLFVFLCLYACSLFKIGKS